MESPSLYLETKVNKKITLEPYELNNDILYNIKNKLRKLESRCHRFGYLKRVLNIYDYRNGVVMPEDLMCRAVYNVTFGCYICDPQVNSTLITKIKRIDDTIISSSVGPVQVISLPTKLSSKFKVIDSNLYYEDKELHKDDYIKVQIVAKKYNEGDEVIKVLGNIVDVSTQEEYNSFKQLD